MRIRIYEKLALLLNVVFIFYHIISFEVESQLNVHTLLYLSVFVWLNVLTYFYEGFKFQMLVHALSHPVLLYSEFADQPHTKGLSMGFFISFSIMAFTLLMFFSPSDNVIIHGKYEVGFKEMVLEAKAGSVPLKVSMFYPIDRKVRTFKDSIASRFTNDKYPLWAPDGEHTVKGLMDSSSFYAWIFQPLQFARIDVQKDEELSKDFSQGAQKLPCMIVSHGAKAHRNFLSGFAREMASQGSLVLCPEHTDESGACFFDEKNMRMDTYMSKRNSETDVELWRRRLHSRSEDVGLLLGQIHGKEGTLLGAGEVLDIIWYSSPLITLSMRR